MNCRFTISDLRFHRKVSPREKIGIRQSTIENHLEGFAFDSSEIEPAVVAHKTDNRIELLIDELRLVADNCNPDNRDVLAVLMIDF